MKKIWLKMGTISSIIIANSSIIACNNSKEDSKNITEIFIENKSPKEVLNIINNNMKIFMKENAKDIIQDLEKLKNYMNGIQTKNAKFLFKGYKKQYVLNLTKIGEYINQIKEVLKLEKNKRIKSGLEIALKGLAVGPTLIAKQTSMTYGILISEFMNLMKEDNSTIKEKAKKHPYINMLKEYHKQIWAFVNSDLYKKWIENKTFNVFIEKNKKIINKRVKPGEFMDNQDEMQKITNPKSKIQNEFSNFEGQLMAYILNLNK